MRPCNEQPLMAERDAQQSCPQCKGSGKIQLTELCVDKPARIAEMQCISCDGTGVPDAPILNRFLLYTSCWCSCPTSEDLSAVFHDDGYTPLAGDDWCVTKHHWHCAQCHKLVQIG